MSEIDDIVTVLQEDWKISPLSDHCASIATVVDEELEIDQFVGILEEPNDSAIGDIVSHVAVEINGEVYDGSGKYDSRKDFVTSVVRDRFLLPEDDWEQHLWVGESLPDVPYTKDLDYVREIIQNR